MFVHLFYENYCNYHSHISIYCGKYTLCIYDAPQWTGQTDWNWNRPGIIYVYDIYR